MLPWKSSICMFAVLILALAGRAEAACDNNVRVQPEDSQCLIASHSKKYYTARNTCTHGIRVKLDIANGADSTFDIIAYSGSIDTSWGRWLRGVTCCSDHTSCN